MPPTTAKTIYCTPTGAEMQPIESRFSGEFAHGARVDPKAHTNITLPGDQWRDANLHNRWILELASLEQMLQGS